MAEQVASRHVSAREARECIRGPLSNAEVMGRFKISAQGFADLLKQLFEKKLLTEEDLAKRGIRFKVVKKGPDASQAQPAAPTEEMAVIEPVAEVPEVQPVPRVAILPPPPGDQDDEFLDTVTLTELLTFKTPNATAKPASAEIAPVTRESAKEPEFDEKKGRFSITGLFKKSRS